MEMSQTQVQVSTWYMVESIPNHLLGLEQDLARGIADMPQLSRYLSREELAELRTKANDNKVDRTEFGHLLETLGRKTGIKISFVCVFIATSLGSSTLRVWYCQLVDCWSVTKPMVAGKDYS